MDLFAPINRNIKSNDSGTVTVTASRVTLVTVFSSIDTDLIISYLYSENPIGREVDIDTVIKIFEQVSMQMRYIFDNNEYLIKKLIKSECGKCDICYNELYLAAAAKNSAISASMDVSDTYGMHDKIKYNQILRNEYRILKIHNNLRAQLGYHYAYRLLVSSSSQVSPPAASVLPPVSVPLRASVSALLPQPVSSSTISNNRINRINYDKIHERFLSMEGINLSYDYFTASSCHNHIYNSCNESTFVPDIYSPTWVRIDRPNLIMHYNDKDSVEIVNLLIDLYRSVADNMYAYDYDYHEYRFHHHHSTSSGSGSGNQRKASNKSELSLHSHYNQLDMISNTIFHDTSVVWHATTMKNIRNGNTYVLLSVIKVFDDHSDSTNCHRYAKVGMLSTAKCDMINKLTTFIQQYLMT